MNVTLQQLECFLTIARLKSISGAAEEMYLSQPALTRILHRLEESVSSKLFIRDKHGLILSPEGEYLFDAVGPPLRDLDLALKSFGTFVDKQKKTLSIIVPDSFLISEAFTEAVSWLSAFEEAHPDVFVAFTMADFRTIRHELENGTVHLSIAQEFGFADMKHISYKRCSTFRQYLMLSHKSALASYEEIPFEKFSGSTVCRVEVIGTEQDRRHTIEKCRAIGFEPGGVKFVKSLNHMFHNIATQNAIAICCKFTSAAGSDLFRYIPLPEQNTDSFIAVAWRTGELSAEAKKFIDSIPGEVIEQ